MILTAKLLKRANPQGWTTGTPKDLQWIHNNTKAPQGVGYGQDIEPAGFYCLEDTTDPSRELPPGWIRGKTHLQNPLVLPWGGEYGSGTNWKDVLSTQFKGLKGKKLSQAVLKAGHDAIVTWDKWGTQEIVLLRR